MNIAILNNVINIETLLSAFAGSVVFIFSSSDYGPYKRVILFSISMIIGVNAADFTASLITDLISLMFGVNIFTPDSLGATLSSALAVRILIVWGERVSNAYFKNVSGDKK
ncbi:putative holin [Rahnella aquatilis]|uniref:putative holin n=1 Tax=Rahnella aquatilis TaxID=34038 RepID=UPI0018CD71A1|nr:putative holin [Rahnella aquatilis]